MSNEEGDPVGEGILDERKNKHETVSLEVFITSNWQILTIFGVFAGFTNYMSALQDNWLVTLGFLLTFIVELEILQLLIKTKNKSFLLKTFTLLSVLFILLFAGFIYSNHVSDILSGFGVALYPIICRYKIFILRSIFFISIMTIFLGCYRHLRYIFTKALKLFGKSDKIILAGLLSSTLMISIAFILILWIILAPAGTGPAEEAIVKPTLPECNEPYVRIGQECCKDLDDTGICDKYEEEIPEPTTTVTTMLTTTSSTLTPIACRLNSDCGNQTLEKICYRNDVYIQKTTPICQKPGTQEARCVYRKALEGESITSEANPHERCSSGCEDGICK